MLNMNRLIVGAGALLGANVASAAAVALGVPLGSALGGRLGFLLGQSLGDVLPIAGSGVLLVAAVSLALGIYIVRRKRDR
jgi:hypothetical protein